MYNFANLNDNEFELFAKDIIQKVLGVELRTYTKGRDGGIDIRGFHGNDIIVQVKQYTKSNYSNLLSSLKKEIKKVRGLGVNKYFIVTAITLTPSNEDEIYGLFKGFMDSKENIFDGIRLQDLLSKSENINIIRNHYKLWLPSSNIFDLIFNKSLSQDTSTFIFELEKKSKFFIGTNTYNKAKDMLENNSLILLVGAPGVGKTILSQMLFAYFLDKGYRPIYTSSNTIRDIKQSLNNDVREIIIINDFLGQHYLNFKPEILEELKSLILYISRNKNKKLILNSRLTILNEATRNNQEFKFFFDDNEIERYHIDVSEMSILEKAKLYYTHIYFNDIPLLHYEQIQRDKRYLQIIKHRNFNPRIIDYITKKSICNQVESHEYYDFSINKLENPEDVWKNEFDNLGTFDRILMNTLYSLSNEYVDYKILKECFDFRLSKGQVYDTTINKFDECIDRLSDSLIKVFEIGNKVVSVINPSINDYIYNELLKNANEVNRIFETYVYFEQIVTLLSLDKIKTKQFIINKIINGEFLDIKTYHTPISFQYLYYISEFDIKNILSRNDIIAKLTNKKTFKNEFKEDSILLERFFCNESLYRYYKLDELLFYYNYVEYIYFKADVNFIVKFIPVHESFFKENEAILYSVDDIDGMSYEIEWAIEREIISELSGIINYEVTKILLNIIPNIRILEPDELHELNNNRYDLLKKTKKEFLLVINSLFTNIINKLKPDVLFQKGFNINTSIILEELSFKDIFFDELENLSYGTYSEYNIYSESRDNIYDKYSLIEEYSLIDEMFLNNNKE